MKLMEQEIEHHVKEKEEVGAYLNELDITQELDPESLFTVRVGDPIGNLDGSIHSSFKKTQPSSLFVLKLYIEGVASKNTENRITIIQNKHQLKEFLDNFNQSVRTLSARLSEVSKYSKDFFSEEFSRIEVILKKYETERNVLNATQGFRKDRLKLSQQRMSKKKMQKKLKHRINSIMKQNNQPDSALSRESNDVNDDVE